MKKSNFGLLIIAFCILVAYLTSCKKDNNQPANQITQPPTIITTTLNISCLEACDDVTFRNMSNGTIVIFKTINDRDSSKSSQFVGNLNINGQIVFSGEINTDSCYYRLAGYHTVSCTDRIDKKGSFYIKKGIANYVKILAPRY